MKTDSNKANEMLTSPGISLNVVAYEDYKPTDKVFEVKGASKVDVFHKFYEMNRHLRYCNGEYYKFQSKDVGAEYDKWYKSLSEAARFDMYYGDGIVD